MYIVENGGSWSAAGKENFMKFVSNAKYNEPVESGTIYDGTADCLNIKVHRITHCEGWYLTCRRMNIEQWKLNSKSLMSAINEAKGILKHEAENIYKSAEYFHNSEIEILRK